MMIETTAFHFLNSLHLTCNCRVRNDVCEEDQRSRALFISAFKTSPDRQLRRCSRRKRERKAPLSDGVRLARMECGLFQLVLASKAHQFNNGPPMTLLTSSLIYQLLCFTETHIHTLIFTDHYAFTHTFILSYPYSKNP